jgi:branched-chain amino acid transport system permease protein
LRDRGGFTVPLLTSERYHAQECFTFVGVNVIIITGMALLFGYAGQVSLGHAAFYGIGAYARPTRSCRSAGRGWQAWPRLWPDGVREGLLLALPSLADSEDTTLRWPRLAFGEIMRVAFVEASTG